MLSKFTPGPLHIQPKVAKVEVRIMSDAFADSTRHDDDDLFRSPLGRTQLRDRVAVTTSGSLLTLHAVGPLSPHF